MMNAFPMASTNRWLGHAAKVAFHIDIPISRSWRDFEVSGLLDLMLRKANALAWRLGISGGFSPFLMVVTSGGGGAGFMAHA
jgi:hypothetical protein